MTDRWEKKSTKDALCILWQGYSCRVYLVPCLPRRGYHIDDARPDHESRPRWFTLVVCTERLYRNF